MLKVILIIQWCLGGKLVPLHHLFVSSSGYNMDFFQPSLINFVDHLRQGLSGVNLLVTGEYR